MYDILSVFSVLYPHLSTTSVRQFSRVVLGLLAMTGRVTMLNMSRWTSEGGSYRTVQRFFNTLIPWGSVYWVFFTTYLLDRESAYILAGDETIVSKSGQSTYGLSRFFSSAEGKTIPGLAFLGLSLVSVKERRSYPMVMEQIVRSDTRSPSPPASESPEETQQPVPRRKRGRPKGSRNRNKTQVQLSETLKHLQTMIKALLRRIDDLIPVRYLVLDGYFGHNMVDYKNKLTLDLKSVRFSAYEIFIRFTQTRLRFSSNRREQGRSLKTIFRLTPDDLQVGRGTGPLRLSETGTARPSGP